MTCGWKSSEFAVNSGAIPTLIYLASTASPAHTKIASIIAVAALSAIYTIARTWLKANPTPTVVELGSLLDSQFPSADGGGQPTSTDTVPNKLTPVQDEKS